MRAKVAQIVSKPLTALAALAISADARGRGVVGVIISLALALALTVQLGCDSLPILDGDGSDPDCFIGDPAAQAELALVFRTADGAVTDLIDGETVPLIRPPQGGQVTLIGVKAKNVSCRAQLSVGLFDECAGRFISREGRPIELLESADSADNGFGKPAFPETLQNYANIAVCPNFGSTRDGDAQPYRVEMRLTERIRADEDVARSHVLTATVTPICGEPALEDECRCECDAGFTLEQSKEEQCPTINDDDPPPPECALPDAAP